MSRLITNAIRSTSASADAITFDNSGKPTFPNGGAGKILQVKQVVKTDTFTSSVNGTDVTGLSVTMDAPASSSNKYLIFANVPVMGSNYWWRFKIKWDNKWSNTSTHKLWFKNSCFWVKLISQAIE